MWVKYCTLSNCILFIALFFDFKSFIICFINFDVCLSVWWSYHVAYTSYTHTQIKHITQACLNRWNVSFTVWQLRRTIGQSGEHFHIPKLFNNIPYEHDYTLHICTEHDCVVIIRTHFHVWCYSNVTPVRPSVIWHGATLTISQMCQKASF